LALVLSVSCKKACLAWSGAPCCSAVSYAKHSGVPVITGVNSTLSIALNGEWRSSDSFQENSWAIIEPCLSPLVESQKVVKVVDFTDGLLRVAGPNLGNCGCRVVGALDTDGACKPNRGCANIGELAIETTLPNACIRFYYRESDSVVGSKRSVEFQAGAACGPVSATSKTISGYILGADWDMVDVMLGFDVIDGAGHKIDLGSLKEGYSAIQRINHCAPATGLPSSSEGKKCPITGRVLTYTWSLRLPPSAVYVYIEVYPKNPTSTDFIRSPTYTGPAPGSTNVGKYGLTYVRQLLVAFGNLCDVWIVLPLQCGQPHGTTGSLYGHLPNWPLGAVGAVHVWSMAPNTLATQGFGLGLVDVNGNYVVNGLQSGQRYGLLAGGPGYSLSAVKQVNAVTDATLVPAPCARKLYNFNNL